MGSEWEYSALSIVCERVSVGHVGLTSEYFCSPDDGIPLIRSQNVRPGHLNLTNVEYVTKEFHERTKKSQLHTGDILFVRVGQNRGDCCVVPDGLNEMNCANIVFARPLKGLSRFLGYYFQSSSGQEALQSISTGSAQGVLNTMSIASLVVPVPPLKDAEAIAHILGTLDDKIKLLRSMNETLEAMARALFKSWFIDFDPVRKKMEGKPTGLPPEIDKLFPDSFVDSELGEIPKGWVIGKMGDFCSAVNEQVSPESMKGDENYVGLEHIPRESISLTDWGTSTDLQSNKSIFHVKDILFGKLRPYFHKVVFAPMSGICSTDILVIRPIKGSYWGFSLMHLSSENMIERATAFSNGTKMPRTKWDDLQSCPIVKPPEYLTSAYNSTVSSLLDSMGHNADITKTMSSIRDSLLPKLISGELELSDKAISKILESVK